MIGNAGTVTAHQTKLEYRLIRQKRSAPKNLSRGELNYEPTTSGVALRLTDCNIPELVGIPYQHRAWQELLTD